MACTGCNVSASALTVDTPVDDVKKILESHDRNLPGEFFGFPNVAEAFRQLLRERAESPPKMPDFPHERGIVICGGGWKFFPSIYVTVRMIRATGCELPIQVWYLGDKGEFDIRMMHALAPYDVGWICANSFARENKLPARILGGWEVKPFAAAYSPFKTVILLDADSYPAYNPETFLDHPEFARVGAAFWPDNGQQLERGQWERFGVPYHAEPAWESGQFVVDKSRHWKPLALAVWMNQRSDYVYRHIYGDKDTFHLCWRLCAHEVCIPTDRAGWHVAAFLQKDFSGRTLFVHRTRDKFRLTGSIDGAGINAFYMTRQHSAEPLYIEALPRERFAHDCLREVDELLRPENFFEFVDGRRGWCRDIWDSVNLRNEYQLPRRLPPGSLVVDVGAHVGAFTRAALRAGADHVVAIEPHDGNFATLEKNVAALGAADRVSTRRLAIFDDLMEVQLGEDAAHVSGNTSTISLFTPGAVLKSWKPPGRFSWELGYEPEPPLPPGFCDSTLLDIVLEWCAPSAKNGRVALLKIDAEGAEFPALLKSRRLDLVDAITGEIHVGTIYNGAPRGVDDIRDALVADGFSFRAEQNGPTTFLFWAVRA